MKCWCPTFVMDFKGLHAKPSVPTVWTSSVYSAILSRTSQAYSVTVLYTECKKFDFPVGNFDLRMLAPEPVPSGLHVASQQDVLVTLFPLGFWQVEDACRNFRKKRKLNSVCINFCMSPVIAKILEKNVLFPKHIWIPRLAGGFFLKV